MREREVRRRKGPEHAKRVTQSVQYRLWGVRQRSGHWLAIRKFMIDLDQGILTIAEIQIGEVYCGEILYKEGKLG